MPKRCKTCGTLNDDVVSVCSKCQSSDLVFEEKKVIYREDHNDNEVLSAAPNGQKIEDEKSSVIDHLELLVLILLFVLSVAGFIWMIASFVNGNALLGFILIFMVPLMIYIYWVIMMAYVENLKNGEKSRKALEKIQQLMENDKKNTK
jgi:ABC-type transport system involved in cytochrome bd biosynthesis fused ATPase/permease subunit